MTKMYENLRIIESDVLVIGGGGAGSRAAIEAARQRENVVLVNKGPVGKSGLTVMGGGGIAVVLGNEPKDSPDVHFMDTVLQGYNLNDQNLVEALVTDAPRRAWKELEEWGVKGPISNYLHKVGHSHKRGLFIRGYPVMMALRRELLRYTNIRIIEDCIITKLLTCNGKISGATGLDIRKGEFLTFKVKSVVLATGGLGNLYSLSTQSAHNITGEALGTGVALAYRTGAELIDMEMIQFYPSVIVYPLVVRGLSLSYEIVMGMLDGRMYNSKGEEFLKNQPLVRDIVTKRVYEQIRKGSCSEHGGVYLDISNAPHSKDEIEKTLSQWLHNYKHIKLLGIDFTKQPMEIKPAPSFSCGGVRINEEAKTSIAGLYAAGEVDGNVHGANRLAGNAFPEFLVFGARAGKYSAQAAKAMEMPEMDWKIIENEREKIFALLEPKPEGIRPIELKAKIQKVMSAHVGYSRSKGGLERIISKLAAMKKYDVPRIQVVNIKTYNIEWSEAIEVSLMLETAEIISKSAILRAESRGCHQREDYPERDDKNWLRHTIVRRENGATKLMTAPVVITKLKLPED